MINIVVGWDKRGGWRNKIVGTIVNKDGSEGCKPRPTW